VTDEQTRLDVALGDQYSIVREVGAGGMATVFLARDVKHDRQVALKVLKPELAAALGSERFPREIRIVAQFNHPHILSLYDSGESAGFLYYVMPFVDGESLAERLHREKQLPVPDAVRILREVADALAYSHSRGVVHRDIKPGNVLLSGRHAVVTDFGVAKAVSAAGGDKLTTVGIAVGTPSYMAPEQAMGETDIDARADIYALGILGYEMLAGRLPFEAKTAQGILAAHVMEVPKDIREVRPGIPDPLADALMRCLAKNPADRWQTADELVSHLEMIGSTPSGGITPTHTRPVPKVTLPRTKSPRSWIMGVVAAVVLIGGAIGAWAMTRGGGGSGKIERVGVLAINDISGQDSLFVRAMQDALTTAIAQTGTVGVASVSDMMRYANGDTPDREVATKLNLDALVVTSVFRAGNVMRITVQFSDPVTTRSLWSALPAASVGRSTPNRWPPPMERVHEASPLPRRPAGAGCLRRSVRPSRCDGAFASGRRRHRGGVFPRWLTDLLVVARGREVAAVGIPGRHERTEEGADPREPGDPAGLVAGRLPIRDRRRHRDNAPPGLGGGHGR
jgi:eukaryotic-like serine/threonine-protein kinase